MRISINGSATMVFPSVCCSPDLKATKAESSDGDPARASGFGRSSSLHRLRADASGLEVGTGHPDVSSSSQRFRGSGFDRRQATIPGRLIVASARRTAGGRRHVEDEVGPPDSHMREYLDVLLPLLETGQVNATGEIWSAEVSAVRPTETVPSVMLAALGPQMLDIAGRRTDGTILWLVGPRTIAEHIAPRLNDAAAAPTGPRRASCAASRVRDRRRGGRLIGQFLDGYQDLPSYRAMLDREGAEGPADVAVVGTEAQVT